MKKEGSLPIKKEEVTNYGQTISMTMLTLTSSSMLRMVQKTDQGPFGYGFESVSNFFEHLKDFEVDSCVNDRFNPWSWNAMKTDKVLDLARESLMQKGAWVNNR